MPPLKELSLLSLQLQKLYAMSSPTTRFRSFESLPGMGRLDALLDRPDYFDILQGRILPVREEASIRLENANRRLKY